jgi:hypothetical protein
MGCRHQCKGRRAAAERSAERSKRSKSFRRMGCRRHCKKAACVHSEKHRAQQAKQTLQPHGLSPPLQRAASDASATAAWTATTDAKGSSRALSEALTAASEASAPAASAAVADSKTGVRALSEASSAASEASAAVAIANVGMRALSAPSSAASEAGLRESNRRATSSPRGL